MCAATYWNNAVIKWDTTLERVAGIIEKCLIRAMNFVGTRQWAPP